MDRTKTAGGTWLPSLNGNQPTYDLIGRNPKQTMSFLQSSNREAASKCTDGPIRSPIKTFTPL